MLPKTRAINPDKKKESNQTVLVSVVCVSFNDVHHLKRLLPSLRRQNFRDLEIIIVDNARNAAVRDYITSLSARSGQQRIIYVANTNEGYPGGNLRGVKYARGDFVFILNPDTVVESNSIKTLVRDFSARPSNVMVLVPKILIRQSDMINSIGMKRIRQTENLYTNIGYLEHDHGQFDNPQRVEAFDGSAFIFRKKLLNHTYLFDPRYFFGNETIDLAERMSKLGFSAYTSPGAVVRHELRGTVTSSKQNDRITAIIVRNALIHTKQNTSRAMFLRTLLIGICFRNIIGRLITGHNRRAGIIYLRGLAMYLIHSGEFAIRPIGKS